MLPTDALNVTKRGRRIRRCIATHSINNTHHQLGIVNGYSACFARIAKARLYPQRESCRLQPVPSSRYVGVLEVLVAFFHHRAGFRLWSFLSHLVVRPVALAHVTTSRLLTF
jgi:hypothetical protein